METVMYITVYKSIHPDVSRSIHKETNKYSWDVNG